MKQIVNDINWQKKKTVSNNRCNKERNRIKNLMFKLCAFIAHNYFINPPGNVLSWGLDIVLSGVLL